jgi:hypothetical protein
MLPVTTVPDTIHNPRGCELRLRAYVAAVLSTIGIIAVLPAAPASAAGPAFNYRTQYLAANPGWNAATSCMSLHIYLDSGSYYWTSYNQGDRYWEDYKLLAYIKLDAGWYTWKDCLIPLGNFYTQNSTLDPDKAGLASVTREVQWTVDSGTWTWGSSLER